MNEDIVHLTFPTTKTTAHTLTKLAHIQGKTQQKLLDEICQTYIQEKFLDFLILLKEKGIDPKEYFENQAKEKK